MNFSPLVLSGLLVSLAAPLLFGQAPATPPASEPLIIAHRGDSQARPENTLAAIRSAVAVNTDWIEFDVRSISDGSLYLFHDADLNRFKLGKRKVATLTTNDLVDLDVGTWFDPAYAAERAPSLAAALRACLDGDTLPLIERKTGSAAAYLKVIQELKAEKKVVLQSFDWRFLAAVRKLDPTVRIGALHGKKLEPNQWQQLLDLKPEWVGWKEDELTKERVDQFHEAGFKVAVWTVNDTKIMQRLAGWQVEAIITDRPKAAREALMEPEQALKK